MSVENVSRGLSNLACYTCKRRKTKCSRTLPQCSLCVRIGEGCDYPTSAEKPGPKLGTVQRNRRRRSGLQTSQSPSLISRDIAPISPVESLPAASPRRTRHSQRQDVLSQHSTASPAYMAAERQETRQDVMISEDETRAGTSDAPIFSQIMYPSHEAQTRPQSPAPSGYPIASSSTAPTITVETVCVGLGITVDTYTCLMDLYFEYMTAFSLFRPNTIHEKFQKMASTIEAQALVASMFAFSARFAPAGDFNDYPTPAYFSDMTSKLLERAIVDSGDNTPPLWVLQASVLDTFYHLTRSVRSRSWRLLGNCIRLAYDRKMHLLDLNSQHRAEAHQNGQEQVADWSFLEEQRRCWWAIWEMDVFASTIRRLPTAIDEKQNFTLLPMPDECWFTGINQPSCLLVEDINERWKGLPRVGNTSPKAWFIVINSLMHDAQRLVYNPGTSKSGLTDSQRDDLTIISNSLYCATASLPAELKYSGEMLDFRTKRSAADANFRQYHSDIYAIHNMTQLTQFMVFHNKLCSQAPWSIAPQEAGENSATRSFDHASWSNYMKSAEAIVSIVRNSDHSHFKSVNPFLNNTLWFAAAAQIACVVFGPSSYGRALLRSNYEMLALTIDQFIEFWASIDILRPRLQKIESALRNLSQRGAQQGGDEQRHPRPREGQNRRAIMTQSRTNDTNDQAPILEGMDSNRNMPAGDTDILAFMPLFQDFDDMALLAQQTGVDDFNLELPFGMDDF